MTEYETDIELIDGSNLKYILIDGFQIEIYDVPYLERIKGLYGFIYVTTNLINGKMYVGQRKINKKDSHWKTYLGSGKILKNAIKKYGKENFDRKIIAIAFDKNELNWLEYFYTRRFDCVDSNVWYNIIYGGKCGGGMKGRKFTEEHIKKLSESKKGEKNPNYGKKYTEKELKELSERMSGNRNPMYGKEGEKSPNYGKKHSKETKQKMREAALGEKNHNYGKSPSKETKEKYQKYLELNGNPNNKIVLQYSLNGDFIKKYENATIAAKENNINHSQICGCCREELKSAGGYQWKYNNKNDNKIPLKIEPYKRHNKEKKIKEKRMTKKEVSDYLSTIKSIKINQYTLNNIFIKTYNSAMEAHNLDGFCNSTIGKCCKGEKEFYKGYKWFYADDPNQPDKSKIIYKYNDEGCWKLKNGESVIFPAH